MFTAFNLEALGMPKASEAFQNLDHTIPRGVKQISFKK